MKRFLCSLLVVLMVVTFMVGCTGGTSKQNSDPAQKQQDQTSAPDTSDSGSDKGSTISQDNLIIVGGSSSAVWTIAAAQIGEMIKEIYKDKTINVEPGGAIANYTAVNNGEAQIGLCITCTSWEAWNGASETFPEKMQNVRSWGISWPMIWHCIATDKSGIKTVSDIKGHSISASFPGQTAHIMGKIILDLHGIDIIDDVKLLGQEASDAISSMKDGMLDVYAWNHSIPQASIVELAKTSKVHFVEWEPGTLDEFMENNPQYARMKIPAGTYTFNDKDYDSVGVVTDLIVHKDMDEDLVYNMTKSYWEQQERFLNIMRQAQSYATLETCMKDLIVPLHPGAYKYYVEVGCDVPDRIKPID
jgi:TRAP transporter TAXI family solute receptor